MASFDGCWFVAAVLLLAAAVAQVRRALFTRVGNDPHCRHCGYLLLNLPSANCPECGAAIDLRTACRGRPRRRPVMAALAVLTLFLAAIPTAILVLPRIRGFDWYAHCPAGWLLSDVDASDAARSERAWRELARRAKAKALAPRHRSAFVDALLADAAGTDVAKADRAANEISRQVGDDDFPPDQYDAMTAHVLRGFGRSNGSDAWASIVWQVHSLAITGRLTPGQVDRFFSHALAPGIRVRPRVIAGDEVPFMITGLIRFPFVFSSRVSHADPVFRLDDRPFEPRDADEPYSAVPAPPPGRHELASDVTFTVTRDDGNLLWRRTFTSSAAFDVVPDAPAEAIVRRRDPALVESIRSQIRASPFYSPRNNAMELHVTIQDPPVDVAFDVFVRAYGQETPHGTLALAKGDRRIGVAYANKAIERPGQPLTTVDVILRASPAAARRTTNVTSIWDGEIELKDVVIRPGPLK